MTTVTWPHCDRCKRGTPSPVRERARSRISRSWSPRTRVAADLGRRGAQTQQFERVYLRLGVLYGAVKLVDRKRHELRERPLQARFGLFARMRGALRPQPARRHAEDQLVERETGVVRRLAHKTRDHPEHFAVDPSLVEVGLSPELRERAGRGTRQCAAAVALKRRYATKRPPMRGLVGRHDTR